MKKDIYRSSRVCNIISAAVEYFISMLVIDSYLAKLTSDIGIPDSVTGILTSFVSLGFGFQLFAIFLINKRPVKTWVTVMSIVNQLFFAFVFVIPFFDMSGTVKTVLFVSMLLLAHIILNVAAPAKIDWHMRLVDDDKRGRFTALKEIISLLGGMVFSFAVGMVIDACEANGNLHGAFIFCAVGILGLMVIDTVVLLVMKEKEPEQVEDNAQKVPVMKVVGQILRDKKIFKVLLVSVIWYVALYSTIPFYGTYKIKELGFTMTFVSILSAAYAIARSLASRPLGRYADKHSFTRMLNICFVIVFVAYAINMFTVPANGKVLYTVYYMLYAIAMGGINSAGTNLIYDFVEPNKRVAALALQHTLAGFAGFFATILVGFLVDYIQKSGNMFLGFNVYAQQVVSAIGAAVVLLALLYLNTVVKKMQREREAEKAKAAEVEIQ